MEFEHFAQTVNKKFEELSSQYNTLFVVDINKDELYRRYLSFYKKEDNPLYKERTIHDCQTCRQFIKNIGGVVAIDKNLKLHTVWDNNAPDIYKVPAQKMSKLIKSLPIKQVFLTTENKYGNIYNLQELEDGTIKTWHHLFCEVPNKFVKPNRGELIGRADARINVFRRGLNEISMNTLNTVLQLIEENVLYKGEEYKQKIINFKKLVQDYQKVDKNDLFVYANFDKTDSGIKNTMLGTLLIDLTEGKDLEEAIKSYEAKAFNYKRTKAIVTPQMRDQALKTIHKLGIEDSLKRRYATLDDISINNLLFVNKDTSKILKGSIEDLMKTSVPNKSIKLDKKAKIPEVSFDSFISNVIPNSTKIELMVENKHNSNFMSLIAPKVKDSKNILQWSNNFSWAYKGGVTDSVIKENVKSAGGKVDGVLRFSIQWNDGVSNKDDLDANCITPSGSHIYFGRKIAEGGELDIDITKPKPNTTAVENITFTTKNDLQTGIYKFYIKNYTARGGRGYKAEIEMDSEIYNYSSTEAIPPKTDRQIAEVHYNKKTDTFTITHKMQPCGEQTKKVWGIETNQFNEVKAVMLSPNYWDDNKVGNRHLFFILENCKNPESIRGLYNEFLIPALNKDRKAIDMLGGILQCDYSEEQISGIGFSSTKKDEFIVKVTKDNKTKIIKVRI